MSNTADQLLYWVLQSVRGEDLPVKTVVDGTEYFVISNPLTKRIEKVKANLINDTSLWASYLGDFTNNTGVLNLGKLDESLTIKIDSVNDKIELIGLTEIEAAKIVNDLEVNGALSVDENLRLNSPNGSVNLDFTGNGDYNLQFQQKDGIVALLDDVPSADGFIPYTGAQNDVDLNTKTLDAGFINGFSFSGKSNAGGVNVQTVNARGSNPVIQINDTDTGSLAQIRLTDQGENIDLTLPTQSGQLALKSDIAPPQNLDDVLTEGNTSFNSIDLTGTGDKVNFSFTGIGDSGLTFDDGVIQSSIKAERFQNGLSQGSRIIIDVDGNENISVTNGNTVLNTDLICEENASFKRNATFENNIIIQNDTPRIIARDNQTPSFEMNVIFPELSQDQVIEFPAATGIVLLKDQTPDWSGWAQYGDSQYTSASPLVVNNGTVQTVDIDGLGNTVKSQLPVGVLDFYDTGLSKITPVNNGDGYNFSLSFKGETDNNNGDFTLFLDLGGTFTRVYPDSRRFPRGTAEEHEFVFSFNYYTLGTFVANGGVIKIESGQGNHSFYDFNLQIHKTHNAR